MDRETQKKLLDLVKRNYEEIAEEFDASRKKALWPELLKLVEMVKDGDRVMDVGCGNGRLVEALKNKKIEYLGVDSSKEIVKAAKKNIFREIASLPPVARNDREEAAPRNGNGSFEFQIADISGLDKLPEKDFDYIFCIAVLHHLPGLDLRVQALEQMKNKLKNNGKIILTVWNLWSSQKFKKLIFQYGLFKLIGKSRLDFGDILFDWKNSKGEKISQRYYHAFTENQLKKLCLSARLKMEKIYKDKYNYYIILTK